MHCCMPLARPTRCVLFGLPEERLPRTGRPHLLGLAPRGVCPATRVTTCAVRSYRTISPLPLPAVA